MPGFDTGSLGLTDNSYGFSSGLGNIDPNSGLNSLGAGLMGPNAGTIPNGFLPGASNFVPSDSGISAGALNGNTSFSMPNNSLAQLAGQASKLAGAGSQLAMPKGTEQQRGGSGRVQLPVVNFSNPTVDFAGSQGGSQAGNSLLQLLARYHPGATQ